MQENSSHLHPDARTQPRPSPQEASIWYALKASTDRHSIPARRTPVMASCSNTTTWAFALSYVLLSTAPALAEGGSCVRGAEPAATLFLPYFEVDLANDDGATTMLAVGTRADSETLARVTLWTDWAIPTLSFDLLLRPRSVVTWNLRDVFARGAIPETGEGLAPFGNCSSPFTNLTLDGAALEDLRDRHLGRPSPADGLCSGSDRTDTSHRRGLLDRRRPERLLREHPLSHRHRLLRRGWNRSREQ